MDDYKQDEYYGIQAFLNRTFLFPDAQAPTAVIAEKAEGEVTFVSVFDKTKTQKTTAPRVPRPPAGRRPKVEKGKEYEVAPAKGVRPVPAYSRFAKLAGALATWRQSGLLPDGREPLVGDAHGPRAGAPARLGPPGQPAVAPETARPVGRRVRGPQVRREVAAPRDRAVEDVPAVQRAPRRGPEDLGPAKFAVAPLKPLSPEQFAYALLQATGSPTPNGRPWAPDVTDAALHARLDPQAGPIVHMFADRPGEPEDKFAATLDQTLFLKHGGTVRDLIAAAAGEPARPRSQARRPGRRSPTNCS